MRKVILYIAMSLDGYIADKNGGVDWLSGQGAEGAEEGTYSEFIKGIDTVVMGWNTYVQVNTELSPENTVFRSYPRYLETESYYLGNGKQNCSSS